MLKSGKMGRGIRKEWKTLTFVLDGVWCCRRIGCSDKNSQFLQQKIQSPTFSLEELVLRRAKTCLKFQLCSEKLLLKTDFHHHPSAPFFPLCERDPGRNLETPEWPRSCSTFGSEVERLVMMKFAL